ncbi:hypothetical protein LZ31DRAFT_102641 [Colletotrichum somersetense]|nr:hypothetical protein LZ31DRAFT_102641 [Colletotrichum somersetense]
MTSLAACLSPLLPRPYTGRDAPASQSPFARGSMESTPPVPCLGCYLHCRSSPTSSLFVLSFRGCCLAKIEPIGMRRKQRHGCVFVCVDRYGIQARYLPTYPRLRSRAAYGRSVKTVEAYPGFGDGRCARNATIQARLRLQCGTRQGKERQGKARQGKGVRAFAGMTG